VKVRKVIHHLKGGGWKWHDPKTKSGVRSVVFPSELVAKLQEHRKLQLEQKLKAGKYWKANDLVFCDPIGEPVKQRALRYVFKEFLKKAQLSEKIRMYDCRHFFGTSSVAADVNPKIISREMGHASVAFTLDVYGHVLEEMHETASDKRAELMRSRGGSK
jgi:integrase